MAAYDPDVGCACNLSGAIAFGQLRRTALIECVDALTRVHNQFIAFRPANDDRRAVRDPIFAPIDLPALFAGALVES